MSNATDSIMQEYFEKHYEEHQKLCVRHTTPEGRMAKAFKESVNEGDGSVADAFYRFFTSEMNAAHSGKCLIYMPDFGVQKHQNRKGKLIIEVDWRQSAYQLGEDFFELQLAKKTDLSGVKLKYFDYKLRDKYPTDEWAGRYYNMFVSWEDALPLVQRVLFCSFFRQRFLMTTASRVLGSITTQRFMSAETGQLLSLRSCLLNEYK